MILELIRLMYQQQLKAQLIFSHQTWIWPALLIFKYAYIYMYIYKGYYTIFITFNRENINRWTFFGSWLACAENWTWYTRMLLWWQNDKITRVKGKFLSITFIQENIPGDTFRVLAGLAAWYRGLCWKLDMVHVYFTLVAKWTNLPELNKNLDA